MDKPEEIELLEKYLKLREKLGASKEELISKMENAFLWFVEKRIKDKLSGMAERMALPTVLEVAKEAIAEQVSETLD